MSRSKRKVKRDIVKSWAQFEDDLVVLDEKNRQIEFNRKKVEPDPELKVEINA